MKIAIDYDCTLSMAIGLFSRFIADARSAGHEVKIVTYRHPDNRYDDILQIAAMLGIEVIFTDHRQKAEVCLRLGWSPDIWIDDKPEHIPTEHGMKKVLRKQAKRRTEGKR
ncbi:hypothetical protein [Entomohabitans teleogrylli]|uniref:hypothetical protein n=1 Tax=Entomohabitans teleogrylli TaxID=1384589 RepID=UPI00073D3BBD|nr:hypothetical protein [Entomohabitans teleogrylli]